MISSFFRSSAKSPDASRPVNGRSSVSKDAAETEEFFTPHLGLDVAPYIKAEHTQGIHHVARYVWATRVLQGLENKKIIDIACGAGFGSYMLAKALPACTVIGGDYDDRAIEHAKKEYHADNLHYSRADIVSWMNLAESQPLAEVDVIVSFDTIEHLLHREICLINITSNLSDDGVMLFSTPVRGVPVLNPGWEHHKIEYSREHLKNLLKRFFKEVICPEDDNFPHLDFWNDIINAGKVRYLTKANPVVCRMPIKF